MLPRINKKSDVFKSQALDILHKIGAVQTPDKASSFCLQTQAGALQITVNQNWIACRFKNVIKAISLGTGDRINRHTGKWNWYDGIDDLSHFERELSKLALPIQEQ